MQPVFPGVPLDGILEHAGYTHVHSGVGFTSYGVSGVVNCTRQFILRFSLGNIVGKYLMCVGRIESNPRVSPEICIALSRGWVKPIGQVARHFTLSERMGGGGPHCFSVLLFEGTSK